MNRRDFVSSAVATGLSAWTPRRIFGADIGDRVRVALIGADHDHAVGKLVALQELSDQFDVVGVYEPNARLRARIEAHPKVRKCRWLTEDEAFNARLFQAAIVETPVRDVVATARRCVEAGQHVHVEKPAGESMSDFAALMNVAVELELHVQMGYMFRYNAAFQFCLEASRAGWLGDVFEASGTISKLFNVEQRRRLAEYRGGAMFELGCHLIDFIVALLGPPAEVTGVSTETQLPHDSLRDHQLAVLRYPDAIASVRSSVIEPQGQLRRHLTVVGDGGTLEIRPLEPPTLKLTLHRPAGQLAAGEHVPRLTPSAGRYHAQLSEFAAVIRKRRKPLFSAEHDLAVQRTILQASGLPAD
jgi:predicted dehydrogenase